MKTDIYTLFGMIKNNNAPKRIVFDNQIWNYRAKTDMEGTILFEEYINEETDEDLFDEYLILDILSNEVEILETTITYNQEEKITLEDFKNLGYSLSKIKDKFQEGWEEAEKEDDKIAKFNYTLTGSEIEKIKKDILNLGIKVNEIIDYINKGGN